MFKLSCLILLIYLSLSFDLNAKVAYLPVSEDFLNNPFYPDTRRIFVIDLESGAVIRKLDIGEGVGGIFVSNDSAKVFASVEFENKVVEIDAKSLTVTNTWDNLPLAPYFIVLDPSNEFIYMVSQYGSGIYRLELETNVVTEVNSSLSTFKSFTYSKELKYLAIYQELNERLLIYDLEQNVVHADTTSAGDMYHFTVSSDGDTYYYYDISDQLFYAKKTVDGSVQSSYQPTSQPPNLYIPAVNSDGSIFAASWDNSYIISSNLSDANILSNVGISDFNNTDSYMFKDTDVENVKLAVSQGIEFCITGMCRISGQLTIRKVDFNNGIEQLLFVNELSSGGSGTTARGRFIGSLGFIVPSVPLISNLFIIIMISLIIISTAMDRIVRLRLQI